MKAEARLANIQRIVEMMKFLVGREYKVQVNVVTEEVTVLFPKLFYFQRDKFVARLQNMDLSHIKIKVETLETNPPFHGDKEPKRRPDRHRK